MASGAGDAEFAVMLAEGDIPCGPEIDVTVNDRQGPRITVPFRANGQPGEEDDPVLPMDGQPGPEAGRPVVPDNPTGRVLADWAQDWPEAWDDSPALSDDTGSAVNAPVGMAMQAGGDVLSRRESPITTPPGTSADTPNGANGALTQGRVLSHEQAVQSRPGVSVAPPSDEAASDSARPLGGPGPAGIEVAPSKGLGTARDLADMPRPNLTEAVIARKSAHGRLGPSIAEPLVPRHGIGRDGTVPPAAAGAPGVPTGSAPDVAVMRVDTKATPAPESATDAQPVRPGAAPSVQFKPPSDRASGTAPTSPPKPEALPSLPQDERPAGLHAEMPGSGTRVKLGSANALAAPPKLNAAGDEAALTGHDRTEHRGPTGRAREDRIQPLRLDTAPSADAMKGTGVDKAATGPSGASAEGANGGEPIPPTPPAMSAPPVAMPTGSAQTPAAGLPPMPVAQQISLAISTAEQARETPLDLALDPPELGRVRLSVSEQGGTLTLAITADRPETVELMRRHLDVLQQEASRLGLDALQVRLSQGGQPGHDGNGARPQTGDTGLAPHGTDETDPHPHHDPQRAHDGALDLRL
ncbi:hypothetical protein GCM10023209_22570 [Roseibacterium beibuensis]|uniref:Flagellar hook-length control protein-like C-terminal domain-containing protein n=1 Tax=[Roseibacterium] beibuensis TaxID=1193142 RepID=A0ABP9LDX9_9RHOB